MYRVVPARARALDQLWSALEITHTKFSTLVESSPESSFCTVKLSQGLTLHEKEKQSHEKICDFDVRHHNSCKILSRIRKLNLVSSEFRKSPVSFDLKFCLKFHQIECNSKSFEHDFRNICEYVRYPSKTFLKSFVINF